MKEERLRRLLREMMDCPECQNFAGQFIYNHIAGQHLPPRRKIPIHDDGPFSGHTGKVVGHEEPYDPADDPPRARARVRRKALGGS